MNPGQYKMLLAARVPDAIRDHVALVNDAIKDGKPTVHLLVQLYELLDGAGAHLRDDVCNLILNRAIEHGHSETLDWLFARLPSSYQQTAFRSAMKCSTGSSVLPLLVRNRSLVDWHPSTLTLALMHPSDEYHMWLRPHIPMMAMRYIDQRMQNRFNLRIQGIRDFDIMLPDNDLAVERFLGAFSPDETAAIFAKLFCRGRARSFSLLMRGDITKMRAIALADGGKILPAGWRSRGLARRWRACLRLTPSDLVSIGAPARCN